MKKILSILLALVVCIGPARGKSDDKILYVSPDEVEAEINDYIERRLQSAELKFSMTLYRKGNGVYELFVNTGRDYIDWAKASNRYAVINDKQYPLLLDLDYDFGAPDPSRIGTYGHREVLRIIAINDGFCIRFTKEGICPEEPETP